MAENALQPRALLKKEALDVPVQQVFDQELVLARNIFKQSVDSETITYWIQTNAQANTGGKRLPGPWDLGVDEWPEVRVKEWERDSKSLSGLALKAKFDAKFLEFGTSQLEVADRLDYALRYFAEKFETDGFNAHTNTRSTTKGTEFDAQVTQGTMGYASTGGHLVYTPSTGNKWNAGGDIMQQIREMMTVFRTQGRIASLEGEVRISPKVKAYTDGLTLGVMHDQMRIAGLAPQAGAVPGSVVVPGLYGVEFVAADFAIQTTGDMLFVDEGARPVVGYYHEYNRLKDVGFRTIASEAGFPLQVKDIDHDNGDMSVAMACGAVFTKRKPKHIVLAHGLI